MMEDKLQALFFDVLNHADDEERTTLEKLLTAIKEKQNGTVRTYLNSAMNYRGRWVGDNNYEATINLQPFFMNAIGILHGGITATFADTAMGTMVNERLAENLVSVTSEIKLNYLLPITDHEITCQAEIVHSGKSLWVTEGKIFGKSSKPLAFASGTFYVVPKR